ncbi:MAG: ABC transporter ATP-binding protein [Candidatus Competibacterales bacterium]
MLSLRDVHAFYGESHVLQGVDLEVAAGQVVCLLGRNGAGKTTTLRAIMGLTPARRGEVQLAGRAIQGLAPHRIARLGVGFVPEDRRIFPTLSVLDNLRVVQGKALDGAKARRWSLERVFSTFPILSDIRHRPGDLLSGGQQQMLAIARALVTEPDVLLLDEPNEGLAPVIVEDIGRLIDDLAGETTLLFTEHKLRFALHHAQYAYIIEKGRIPFHGPVAELRDNPDIQRRYLSV